ncbi:glycosyl transferase family 2 [Halobacteriales archaeon QH_7_65_31]|nr:MAG: glycosyl transferase family 2 [Halobacteriales archaeon QH_7_65_31]
MPLVSALIPTYNRADRVGGAIESVLAQSHDEIEAVVVNDGSTDETRETLEAYADDDRVRVRHNDENRGIAATFDRAAAVADGEYLGILGDDDRWRPEKTSRQLDRFAQLDDEYGLVYAGGTRVDDDGTVLTEVRPTVHGDCYPEILTEFPLAPHSSHLIRASCLEQVGGFDTDFPAAVDWEVNIRLAREFRVAYVDEILVDRQFHGDNVSGGALTGDPAYQVAARDRIRRAFREELRAHPKIERRFAAAHEKHRGRVAVGDRDRRRATAHFLAASLLAPTVEHLGSLATAAVHPRLYDALAGRETSPAEVLG